MVTGKLSLPPPGGLGAAFGSAGFASGGLLNPLSFMAMLGAAGFGMALGSTGAPACGAAGGWVVPCAMLRPFFAGGAVWFCGAPGAGVA